MMIQRLVVALLLLSLLHLASAQCPAVRKCLSSPSCDRLPVPNAVIPPPLAAAGYNLTLLRQGVYSWTDGTYYTLILYKSRRLTLVDFPDSSFRDGEYLLNNAVMDVLGAERPKRLDMVYGHRHIDHIGGASAFTAFVNRRFPGLTTFVWGTAETRRFLARNPASKIPKINVMVGKRGRTVNLDDELNLKLTVLGGHTLEDLAAHVLPSRDGPGVLLIADFVVPGFAPFLDFSLTSDFFQYVKTQQELLKFDFGVFIGGHWNLGTKRDIRRNIRYTEDVVKFIAEAADEVTPQMLEDAGIGNIGDPTKVEFGNPPLAFAITLDLQSKLCVRKLIKKYGCVLGGVDLFAASHCKEVFFHNIVDVE